MINFSEKYDRKKFKNFLKDFLPEDLSESDHELQIDDNDDYLKKATILASVKSIDDIVILEVERSKAEKTRLNITKRLFKLLDIHGYSKALVVTFSKNESHYRFSLITSDLIWEGTRVNKKFSNPKRLSFLLGLGSKVHTATKYLIEQGKVKDFEDLYSRFNIEIINDEFYQHYKNLYINLKNNLDKDKEFSLFAKKINLEISHFAKKLLGQIVFCYFLQKKGWLGVDRGKSFGTGDNSFLRKEFEKANEKNVNFFNKFLEFFFYKGLNNKNDNDYVKEINCRVPYVGGGLFEYYEGYDWEKENLNIPNSTFSNDNKDGILDIFELYNFTVDENETIDVEISIDPEMLGRVFENLLEENIRKKGGSFYTPRSIVNHMCEDSLANYICNKLNNELNIQQISNFVSNKDFDINKNNFVKVNATQIDFILEDIKICDPAIGSGAFAVGIVNLISRLRVSLKNFVDRKYKNTSYYFKRDCIQNSIYGVDIDASAVEITKLRLWLSLISEEEDYSSTEPLPNLDYKIMQGDSLIDEFFGYKFNIDENKNNQLNLYDEPSKIDELVKSLNKLQTKYMNLKQFLKRKEIKKEIERVILKIFQTAIKNLSNFDNEKFKEFQNKDSFSYKKEKNFFCWGLFFAEIFYNRKGFDLIIANPPYVEFKLLPKIYKEKLHDYFSAKGKFDIYVPFTEKCLKLLNENGYAILIQPTSFLKKNLGKYLRIFLEKKAELISIHDFNDIQIFSNVTNYTGLFLFRKKKSSNYNFDINQYNNNSDKKDKKIFNDSLKTLKNTDLKEYFKVESKFLKNDTWNFQNNETQKKLSIISNKKKLLKDFCYSIFQGIASGKDEVFYINAEEISEHKIEKNIIKKILRGRDLKSYQINWSGSYVIYPYDENSRVLSEKDMKKNYPNAYYYLKTNKKKLQGRDYFDQSNKLWFELWNQRKVDNFNKLRIVVPEISSKSNFVLTDSFFGTTKTYHLLPINRNLDHIKILLALLNSRLIDYYYKKITTPQRGGYFAYKTKFLELIPIEESIFKYKELIPLVDEILKIKKLKSDNESNNKINDNLLEIDNIVYKAYNVYL